MDGDGSDRRNNQRKYARVGGMRDSPAEPLQTRKERRFIVTLTEDSKHGWVDIVRGNCPYVLSIVSKACPFARTYVATNCLKAWLRQLIVSLFATYIVGLAEYKSSRSLDLLKGRYDFEWDKNRMCVTCPKRSCSRIRKCFADTDTPS